MAILPLAGSSLAEHARDMAMLLILLVLWVLIAVAQWRGWTVDTRDGRDWAPMDEVWRQRTS
jgi:hypothetical protein